VYIEGIGTRSGARRADPGVRVPELRFEGLVSRKRNTERFSQLAGGALPIPTTCTTIQVRDGPFVAQFQALLATMHRV
jgi:hypothetical protein